MSWEFRRKIETRRRTRTDFDRKRLVVIDRTENWNINGNRFRNIFCLQFSLICFIPSFALGISILFPFFLMRFWYCWHISIAVYRFFIVLSCSASPGLSLGSALILMWNQWMNCSQTCFYWWWLLNVFTVHSIICSCVIPLSIEMVNWAFFAPKTSS